MAVHRRERANNTKGSLYSRFLLVLSIPSSISYKYKWAVVHGRRVLTGGHSPILKLGMNLEA